MRRTALSIVHIRARPGNRQQGWLCAGSLQIPVALGRGGIRADKREGDGGTPRGRFRPLRLWWRADRAPRPATLLPARRIRPALGWCENPADRRYNNPVVISREPGVDRLWRQDGLYDTMIEIDHNVRPRVAGRGSAVFIHVARSGLGPTAGCIGLPPQRLRWLVGRLARRTIITIG
jgi:L,D-peptidoglycan transpeptidase YkuD (ErfK/YbiS/YcfS/YnhG family)